MTRKKKRSNKGLTQKQVGLKYGFRSGLEEKVYQQLVDAGIEFQYESHKVTYIQPEVERTYTPDFVLDNGIIIETKGRLILEDRKKHLWIKRQWPQLDIRFVFSNSKNKIRKGSKTSYAMWCKRNKFQYADKEVPTEWLQE